MKYIARALIALLWVLIIDAQTENDIINNGIEAGTELAKAIADKNFASTMGKLARNVGPYLGMVGPVIGILFAVVGGHQESEELKFMRKMLSKIENRFDQVDTRLDEIAQKIDWSRVQIQFFTYEKNILPMKMELDKFYNATNSAELTIFNSTFLKMYECVYVNSAYMLFKHIISDDSTFSSNLLLEAMKANEYDRKDIQVFMLGLVKLVLVGSQIEMVYYKLKIPSYTKRLQKNWVNRLNQMRKAMEAADLDVKNKYKEVALEDAKKILTFSKGRRNSNVANEIFQKLSEKFYWRNWFVGVYDKINDEEHHEFWACKGDTIYHAGFNLLLASNAKSTKPLDRFAAGNVIKNVESSKKFLWVFSKSLNAKELSAKLKPIQDCRKYSAFGVIKENANFEGRADSKRLVISKKNHYKIFLFN